MNLLDQLIDVMEDNNSNIHKIKDCLSTIENNGELDIIQQAFIKQLLQTNNLIMDNLINDLTDELEDANDNKTKLQICIDILEANGKLDDIQQAFANYIIQQ